MKKLLIKMIRLYQKYISPMNICEYPLDGDAMQEPNARMITWRLAKRAARDFLRVSFMTSAIVTAAKADKPFTVVRVYGRY